MRKRERHLTKRDRKILEFVARYRIGTRDLFRRQCFEAGTKSENVNRVLNRLVHRKLLSRVNPKTDFTYYTATRHTAAFLEQEPRTPRPLTEQTVPVLLAIAAYCVERGIRRKTSKEFKKLYPELWRPGMRSSSYVLFELDGKLRLEMLLVDQGGAAHRINSRVRRLIAQRQSLPAFRSLIKGERFRIAVLTGTPEQQQKIQNRINRRPLGPVTVSTH